MTENLEKGLDETVNKELQPCPSAIGPRFFVNKELQPCPSVVGPRFFGDKIWLTWINVLATVNPIMTSRDFWYWIRGTCCPPTLIIWDSRTTCCAIEALTNKLMQRYCSSLTSFRFCFVDLLLHYSLLAIRGDCSIATPSRLPNVAAAPRSLFVLRGEWLDFDWSIVTCGSS